VGECFFWYWPTWVVADKVPLSGCVCVCSLSVQGGKDNPGVLGKQPLKMELV